LRVRDDFDARAWRIGRLHRQVSGRIDTGAANHRLRVAFEAELAAHIEPASGASDAHAAFWDGYVHGRKRLLARLQAAVDGE
jgi:hypothetical protein